MLFCARDCLLCKCVCETPFRFSTILYSHHDCTIAFIYIQPSSERTHMGSATGPNRDADMAQKEERKNKTAYAAPSLLWNLRNWTRNERKKILYKKNRKKNSHVDCGLWKPKTLRLCGVIFFLHRICAIANASFLLPLVLLSLTFVHNNGQSHLTCAHSHSWSCWPSFSFLSFSFLHFINRASTTVTARHSPIHTHAPHTRGRAKDETIRYVVQSVDFPSPPRSRI